MVRMITLLLILAISSNCSSAVLAKHDKERWNKTTALASLPFCALVLRAFLDQDDSGREIYILMEPDQVKEDNLRLLFGAVSEKYPQPLSLRVWVYTDVEELASLATSSGHTAYPDSDARVKKEHQWAYYKRTPDVELFRYNPDYPKVGMKTVVLRGKE